MKRRYLILPLVILISFTAYAVSEYKSDEWPKTDFSKTSVNLDNIISGGPPKDGIPSIDNPKFKSVHEIDDIPPMEPVISVAFNGEARAYPLRILMWHEIVNDQIGDTPIAVTYCPLCNASIVFDRRVDGKTTQFGVTGRLHKSDMIMYDRNTQSWWQQYTGEAIVGEQLGKKLKIIVSRVESLEWFKERYPSGKVLVPNSIIRKYGHNPYINYDSKVPLLYDGEYKGKLPPMTYVVVVGNQAWPLALLQTKHTIFHDDLAINWKPFQNSALDNPVISDGRDVGNVIVLREFEKGKFRDTPYTVTFAFVFDAFHPDGVMHLE